MVSARTATFAGTVLTLLASQGDARAALRRPRFEPTDLEMEEAGTVELDLQVGASRDEGALRLVAPNFELDVGLLPSLELDLDGTVSLVGGAGPDGGLVTQIDNLWVSTKIGLAGVTTDDKRWAFSLGLQMGPRIAVAEPADGVGYQGLLLAGLAGPRTHLVLNLGGFSDPAPRGTLVRPAGLVAGLDAEIELDGSGRFALLAELFTTVSLGDAPDEYGASAGLQWSPAEWLDLSLIAIAGHLGGGTSYGGLLGISPKLRLWR